MKSNLSSEDRRKVIEWLSQGRHHQVRQALGLSDYDEIYELVYECGDEITKVDADYFVARRYFNATFNYVDRVQQNILRLYEARKGEAEPFRVLELGCGDGSIAAGLARLIPQACIDGVELTRSGVEKASQHATEHLRFIECDAYLYEPDHKYDCVYSLNVLEHVSDGSAYLDKCLALLKDGGQLLICCPTKGGWVFWGLPKYLTCKIMHRSFQYHGFNSKKLAQWAKTRGLRVVAADFCEFAMPRRIYRYVPASLYGILGALSGRTERLLKRAGLGRVCNFQYWHFAQDPIPDRGEALVDATPADDAVSSASWLWVLPGVVAVYLFYGLFMTWEVLARRKSFFAQD